MCALFFFFKQKTAYEMRISDWSSDVCSSDLGTTFTVSVDGNGSAVHVTEGLVEVGAFSGPEKLMLHPGQTGSISSKPGSKLQSEIGRASCRERVCQYV